jgi:hypothetical protein
VNKIPEIVFYLISLVGFGVACYYWNLSQAKSEKRYILTAIGVFVGGAASVFTPLRSISIAVAVVIALIAFIHLTSKN